MGNVPGFRARYPIHSVSFRILIRCLISDCWALFLNCGRFLTQDGKRHSGQYVQYLIYIFAEDSIPEWERRAS